MSSGNDNLTETKRGLSPAEIGAGVGVAGTCLALLAWNDLSKPPGGFLPPGPGLSPLTGAWCGLGGLVGAAAVAGVTRLRGWRAHAAGGPSVRPDPVANPVAGGRQPRWLRAATLAVLAATLVGLWWGWERPGNWAYVLGGVSMLQGAAAWGLSLVSSVETYRRYYGDPDGEQVREFGRKGWVLVACGAAWIAYESFCGGSR